MKRLVLIFSLTFLSLVSFSKSNPLIRTCRIAGGKFFSTSDLQNSRFEEINLCIFEKSTIDALSLVYLKEGIRTDAVKVYVNGLDRNCSGQNVSMVTSPRDMFICEFKDGSFIDIFTLERGFSHQENLELDSFILDFDQRTR